MQRRRMQFTLEEYRRRRSSLSPKRRVSAGDGEAERAPHVSLFAETGEHRRSRGARGDRETRREDRLLNGASLPSVSSPENWCGESIRKY
jgi:hypothetical protein